MPVYRIIRICTWFCRPCKIQSRTFSFFTPRNKLCSELDYYVLFKRACRSLSGTLGKLPDSEPHELPTTSHIAAEEEEEEEDEDLMQRRLEALRS